MKRTAFKRTVFYDGLFYIRHEKANEAMYHTGLYFPSFVNGIHGFSIIKHHDNRDFNPKIKGYLYEIKGYFR